MARRYSPKLLACGSLRVEAASRRYFGKAAAELNEDEAARLAAGLPRPRAWHPGVGSPARLNFARFAAFGPTMCGSTASGAQ